jgi:hypothetical protein
VLTVCAALPLSASDSENDWFVPLGPPPKAAPRRISGGESFPPLPLPATPLRRSERKKTPRPPTLIGKVVWGESATFAYADGAGQTEVSDWNQCPADLQSLLGKAARVLGTSYTSEAVQLSQFDGDPATTPVLWISGSRRLRLDAAQLAALKAYVLRGGLVVCDSVAGSPWFTDTVRTALGGLFPDSPFRVLPLDHPLYHLAVDADKVAYPRGPEGNRPQLEGIYIGCRVGVLLSPIGLGCGLDDREVPNLPQARFHDVDSANRIGVNLIAYAIGYAQVGEAEARPELFGAADQAPPSDEFVFAQLVHSGHWNVHPGCASALLTRMQQATAVRASLKRIAVDPERDPLAGRHFLYLTGLDDFRFSDQARKNLRRFLEGGGTLLVNNGLGLATFDVAVRAELKHLLPEAALQPIPVDHPLFAAAVDASRVRYTPEVLAKEPKLEAPRLEGIALGGDLRVIYSPYDLEAGWAGGEHPGMHGYDSDSSRLLGMDLVMYVMTH